MHSTICIPPCHAHAGQMLHYDNEDKNINGEPVSW